MRKLQIILFFSLFVNYLSAQDFNGQIRRLKLMMLPETSFRFPCGDSVGHGYYIAQGFQDEYRYMGSHLGFDISGLGGGDTDLGDTIYSIGYGIVAFMEDVDYLSIYYKYNGQVIKVVYYHCLDILCKPGQLIPKGFPVATIGNSDGAYLAHLHLEMITDTSFYAGFYGEPEGFIDPEPLLPFYKNK